MWSRTLCVLFFSLPCYAVTIYTTLTDANAPTTTSSVDPATYTGLTAYSPLKLIPPKLPEPRPPTNFLVQLLSNDMPNLSIPLKGNFFGFSIELSVSDQVLGKNTTFLNVPFLNLMSNIRARAKAGPIIRVGGNSQEDSKLFINGFENHKVINKHLANNSNPTATPDIDFSDELLYTMAHISDLVDVNWYFGLAFADPTNTTGLVAVASEAQKILGNRLLSLQMGNEPDLYGIDARRRPEGYTIGNFVDEWKTAISALHTANALPQQPFLMGPSVCCNSDHKWSIDDVFNAGWVDGFSNDLAVVTVQHYPRNNCKIGGVIIDPQTVYDQYLTHVTPVGLVAPYLATSAQAQQANKPYVMFETNTASCGGFAGLSDSFGAALWALDYTLQMGYGNFSHALFHVGGQNVAYNPFMPPPGSQASFHEWTVTPLYYAALATAETFGSSNASRIVDLFANNANNYTPAYAIYENGNPTRVALFNYMTDPTGASDYVANIAVGGGESGQPNTTPAQVYVRYLDASSVADKFGITWAGQTLGGQFQSDGRLSGDVNTTTVNCDTAAGTCPIRVKAPSFALVFLTSDAVKQSTPDVPAAGDPYPLTFSTSTLTKKDYITASVDQVVLATSNGRGGAGEPIGGSTSRGKENMVNAASAVRAAAVVVLAVACGGIWVGLRR